MLKKLLVLLCLGAFVAVATIGGCGKAKEEPAKEKEKVEEPEPVPPPE